MKLYHFINEKYGLEAITKQRLKASLLDDVNDPFELYAIDLSSSPELRDAFKSYKDYLSHTRCLLCFSKTWESPLLWGHYADKHKGMALVFEVNDSIIRHVEYHEQRIKINEAKIDGEDTTMRLLTTKYVEWTYEKEARVFKPVSSTIEEVNSEKENLLFIPFDSTLALKSVILGPLSKTENSTIQDKLPTGVSIDVIRSRMASGSFKIVRNEAFQAIKLRGSE